MMKLGFALLFSCLASFVYGEQVKVVSLSTVLTEVTEKVGGDKVQVIGLIKPLVDPHDFEPTPGDIAEVASAQLIFASGKHMEGYLTKLEESSRSKGKFVEVGSEIPSLAMPADGHNHSLEDPHWWHSVSNVRMAANIVRDELIKVDPANAAAFRKQAADYDSDLATLEKWIRTKVAELPRDRRKLVTSHDAFQYFSKEFGFTVYPIEGVNTEDEPTNKEVVGMISEIKKQGVKAIFVEAGANPKVTSEIARETGAKISGTLVADGLGTGEAATYEGMMRANVTTIVEALK